jgi:hypothetical protein
MTINRPVIPNKANTPPRCPPIRVNAKPLLLVREVVVKYTDCVVVPDPSRNGAGGVQVAPVTPAPGAAQAMVIDPVNPFTGAKLRLNEAGIPAPTVSAVVVFPEESSTVKSGTSPLPVSVAVSVVAA